ncbi:MAG: hypothetical protein LBH68_05025, partial [Bifidobacteriaceae bacterium]|nr:hypothetical protein [Bifidobacteriaceae bacterium]
MTRTEKTALADSSLPRWAFGRLAARKVLAATAALSLVVLLPGPVAAQEPDPAAIESASTQLGDAPSNVDYSKQEEWEQVFPNGTFIVEHSEYTVREGGDDPDNPQDVYLGINIARMGGRDAMTTVTFAVGALTADDADFVVEDDTLTFQPGEEQQTAYIKILDDNRAENDRFLTFTLVDAGNGHLGHLTTAMIRILDNEEYVETVFAASAPDVTDKSMSAATVTVTRDEAAAPYFASVVAKTADGTAKAGTDYEAVEQTVVFSEGETSKEVLIPLLQTGGAQTGTVALTVGLSDPKGGRIAEGSQSVEVRLTDQNPDPANPIHNSESLSAALGAADQTDQVQWDPRDVTENEATVAVNQNDAAVSRPLLLANALGAARGLAAIQPFNAAYWGTERVLTDLAAGEDFFGPFVPCLWNGRADVAFFIDAAKMNDPNGYWDNADKDVLLCSYYMHNLNQFKRLRIEWENNPSGIGGAPYTHFGYYAGSEANANEIKVLNNQGVGLLWREQGYLNPDTGRANLIARGGVRQAKTMDTVDLWYGAGGLYPTLRRNARLYAGVYDAGGSQWNKLKVHQVRLERAQIPDIAFQAGLTRGGATNLNFASDTGFSFTKDGFDFTVQAVPGAGGRW